jgi:hypothetical protein
VQNQQEPEKVQVVVRKRRTRRHRRNRLIQRASLALVFVAVSAGGALVALQYLSPSLFHASRQTQPDKQAVEASRNLFLQTQQDALQSMQDRPVYPYSIIRGGVKDAKELRWAADHDPVVAAHYAGFDYEHAHVVELVLARTVYVSYRIGNKVYWTHHRVTLKKGEKLLTDGKITARTKCGNRVEEAPQVAVSTFEPPPLKFDEPELPILGPAASNPPVAYQSTLIGRPGPPGLGPAPPLGLYAPLGGGTWVPVNPPPLPVGLCGPVKKKPTTTNAVKAAALEAVGKITKKKPAGPCTSGAGGEVPEPGTWLLMICGLTVMFWMARRRIAGA